MRKNIILTLVLTVMLVVPFLSTTASGYNDIISPTGTGNVTISWTVVEAPDTSFAWLNRSFAVLDNWIAEVGSKMTFEVTEVGGSDEYISGILRLGNMTFSTNNSLIAYNLVLAISNFMAPWEPGLVIPTGTTNIQSENASAYAAGARVLGNWVNGTVESNYENLTIGGSTYECIIWDYVQDPSGFGEPQRTNLAYDLATGVLVRANTSINFGTPYNLVLELDSIQPPVGIDLPVLMLIIGGLGVVAIVVIFFLRRK